MSHFGIRQGSLSPRSEPLLRAVGVDPQQYGAMNLGSPDYLTSSRRQRILTCRDHYRAIDDPVTPPERGVLVVRCADEFWSRCASYRRQRRLSARQHQGNGA